MKVSLFLLLFTLIISACQVKQDLSVAKQTASFYDPALAFTVTLPSGGWKKLGEKLVIVLTHQHEIQVMGTPYIKGMIGSEEREFTYASGSGSKSIYFEYTVTDEDLDEDGINFSDMIELNGGKIYYIKDNIQNSPPLNIFIPQSNIRVDGISPETVNVIPPPSRAYFTGEEIIYKLVFSEEVRVNASGATLKLLLNSPVTLSYVEGSGTNTLIFKRTLLSSDVDSDGSFSTQETDLSQKIFDSAGNPFSIPLPEISSLNTFINPPQPKVTNVILPTNGIYNLGDRLDFRVTYDSPVTVTGAPVLKINLASGPAVAKYLSIANNTLLFRYTVNSGDNDVDGLELQNKIELQGGTIKSGQIPSSLDLPASFLTLPNVYVRSPTPFKVLNVQAPDNKTYKENESLIFRLNFNRTVNVTGTPRLTLNLGTQTRFATYISHAGEVVSFKYDTVLNDFDPDGIVVSSMIDLNGGNIFDNEGVVAITSFPSPVTTGVRIDAQYPFIQSVTIPANGLYTTGSTLEFNLRFNEIVTVSGTPSIEFIVGNDSREALYISGSGTKNLIFKYIVKINDSDSDGITILNTLKLNGGQIIDSVGNTVSIDLFFNQVSGQGIKIDGLLPHINSITPPLAGTYKVNENLDFMVKFSEIVHVSSSPYLLFEIGNINKRASYFSGSGTDTLTFRYTVLSGDEDNQYISVIGNSIILGNLGSIKDVSGNAAGLTFTPPLTYTIKVDAKPPKITSIGLPTPGFYKANSELRFTVNWSEDVTITGSPNLVLSYGGMAHVLSYNYYLSNPTQTVFTQTVTSTPIVTSSLNLSPAISLGGGTIRDSVGNDANIYFISPLISGITIDTISPTVSSVHSSTPGNHSAGVTLKFIVTWSEVVTISPLTMNLEIELGNQTKLASLTQASNNSQYSIFTYQVQAGDSDPDGVKVKKLVNYSSIKDKAQNEANANFTETHLTNVKVDALNASIINVSVAPGLYKTGDHIDFTYTFSENIFVTGNPKIKVNINNQEKEISYFSGNGTNTLIFRYTVAQGDDDYQIGPISELIMGTATLKDSAGNNAELTYNYPIPCPGVGIDTTAPIINDPLVSENLTQTQNDERFLPSEVIQYKLEYHEDVVVSGSPRLKLTIGNQTKYAIYDESNSSGKIVKFKYTIPSGNTVLDLDGIEVQKTIDLSGGTIKDLAGNNATLTFTHTEIDYVYFSNMVGRYNLSTGNFTQSNNKVTELYDLTGKSGPLKPESGHDRPSYFINGFGTKNKSYMRFDPDSSLRTIKDIDIKYAIFALKTPQTNQTGNYTLLSKCVTETQDDGQGNQIPVDTWTEAITFRSTSSDQAVLLSPEQKVKFNGEDFNSDYVSIISSVDYWSFNTPYIYVFDLETITNFEDRSTIGAGGYETPSQSFEGDVAEIIFVGSGLSEDKINMIRDQLNEIYGIY